MRHFITLLFGIVLLSAQVVAAKTLSFQSVWTQIDKNSVSQKAANLQVQAVGEAKARAQRHWLPRVYIDARTYRTNDPSSSFFGILEQRQVKSSDFVPSALNQPDAQTFSRSTVGLDLPLYEGGMKTAQSKMLAHSEQAEKFQASQVRLEQFAQAGYAYGAIATLQSQARKLTALQQDITKLMKGYQLGQKSNPVGYSGLLGMRSLDNRLSGLIQQYAAQEKAYYALFSEMGLATEDWSPENLDLEAFTNDNFREWQKTSAQPSFKIDSSMAQSEAAEELANTQRARYLPRVGAFAESYLFDGSRDTSNGYTAGLYLQWSLFDPADFGAYKESKIKSHAAKAYAQALRQQENAERAALSEGQNALKTNLSLLQSSDELLGEQAKVSSTLFRNGSISALQFVEILNRRTDLVVQQTDAQLEFLKTATTQLTKHPVEIPKGE